MKPKVYIETTIPSYLAARPSRDLFLAADQQRTLEWWEDRRGDFDLFISQHVVRECQGGNPSAAAKRLEILHDIPTLEETDAANMLAKHLVARVPLPRKAEIDALHVAIAAVHDIEYLLTWNCRHLANATLRKQIESVCREGGYLPPIICTPIELLRRVYP